MTTTTKNLYEQIGGAAVVQAAVDVFYGKVLGDPQLSPFFASTNMANQRNKMKAFLTMAFGGPNGYTGRDMRTAHRPLVQKGLGDKHFDAVAGHLKATLDALGVAPELTQQVLTIAGSTRNDVLDR